MERYLYAYLLVKCVNSGVMAKMLDCGLEVSDFELQSRYYVHFQTQLEKVWTLFFPAMVQIVSLQFFFGIE